MKRIYGLLIFVVMIQLSVAVRIASGRLFPDAPSKAFGNGWISQVVYSPDGKRLVVSGSEGIWVYDASTLAQVAHFADTFGRVNTIAISPNGAWLASGGVDGVVRLWEIATGQQVATFAAHNYSVNSVDFSPDGAFLVSASLNATVYLWDVQKREQAADFERPIRLAGEQPLQVRFSPDGRLIAVAGSWGKILVFDLKTQALIHTLDHQAIWPAIAFSADGKTLFSIAVKNLTADVKLWNVDTGKQIDVIKDTQSISVTASPNRDQIVSWGWGPIRLWDTAAKVEVAQFPVDGGVSSLSFHPAGARFAIISNGTTIQIWDVAARKPLIQKETHTGAIRSLLISPDGESFAAVHGEHTVRLWDVQQGIELKRWTGRDFDWRTLAFSPNGEMLASGDSETIQIWDLAKGGTRARFDQQRSKTVVFSPDNQRLFAVNDRHEIKMWDTQGKKELAAFQGDNGGAAGGATALAIHPDGKLLASGGASKAVYLWDVDKRDFKKALRGHHAVILSLAFSPDGQLLASWDGGGNLLLWDLEKLEKIASYQDADARGIKGLTFGPDGRYLIWATMLSENENKMTAFRWRDGTAVDELTFKRSGYFDTFSLSQDGRRLITNGQKILLWNVNFPSLPVEPAQKQPTLWGQVKRTALLPNFPNPFNPETWMPYTLGAESDVTISIYTLSGQQVRTLALGRQPAGDYLTRNKAVYWDGTNDRGEPVASGVYLYELRAGAYREGRKMVLMK